MGNDSFKEFVLDQLAGLPGLRRRAMFGGHGFYAGERFFGILLEGRLYFKTDETNRADYLARGMAPFIYKKARRTPTMRYHEVPPDVLENSDELKTWARKALAVAATKTAAKHRPPRPAAKSGVDDVRLTPARFVKLAAGAGGGRILHCERMNSP